ncbi:heavy-metal-associated domain-containing protein [Staphylococcus sp. 17KM0847]|uniref:heavy-metal-associated domain-containing protein n=1 Tax=Staphylococcus sp. 17KM0847 TaxID=2583989 RepID=UPI0015DD2FD9|nr:heavy-metal-associated domain-containing protein [Staphylococcus sp. 17KM0847]QLK86979.1 heavy-metal-associated domain-containing protein [Staphylococcus sp. 17KM0847]
MHKATLQLETLACPTCMHKIESAIKQVYGVDEDTVKVLFNASKAKVQFDTKRTNIDEITHAVESVGYDVLKTSER